MEEPDTLAKIIRSLDNVRFYVPSSAIYEDLLSTGYINLLQSDSLRFWLMIYNQESKRNDRVEQIDFQFVQSFIVPFQIESDAFTPNDSSLKELRAIASRRVTNNQNILTFNLQLLAAIQNVLRHLENGGE